MVAVLGAVFPIGTAAEHERTYLPQEPGNGCYRPLADRERYVNVLPVYDSCTSIPSSNRDTSCELPQDSRWESSSAKGSRSTRSRSRMYWAQMASMVSSTGSFIE